MLKPTIMNRSLKPIIEFKTNSEFNQFNPNVMIVNKLHGVAHGKLAVVGW